MSESTDESIGSMAPAHYGAAGSSVFLSEATIVTAWNVQGSAGSSALRAEVQRIAGVALPDAANTTSQGTGVTFAAGAVDRPTLPRSAVSPARGTR